MTIYAIDITDEAVTVPDWTGDQQPVWVAVRPNLRRIHVLAGDILLALGKSRDIGGRGRNESVDVQLAIAWLQAHHVPAVVVVNTQHLHPRILNSLAMRLTPCGGHLILGSALEEGARVGPSIEVPAGVPA